MYGLLGIVILTIGVWAIVYVLRTKAEARDSAGWLQTMGRVRTAKVRQSSQRSRPGYYPFIEYDYRVNDKPYQGNRWNFGTLATHRPEAEVVIQRYPPGSNAVVYYNPRKPAAAVLEREISGAWVGLVVGGVFSFAGLVMVTFWLLTAY